MARCPSVTTDAYNGSTVSQKVIDHRSQHFHSKRHDPPSMILMFISGSDSITQEAKNSLRKNHSLAAFIDLMSTQGFRDWYETDFIDYLCGDNEVSLTDIIEFCNSNFKG